VQRPDKGGPVLMIPVRAKRASGLVEVSSVEIATLGSVVYIARDLGVGMPSCALSHSGATRLAMSRLPSRLAGGCTVVAGDGYLMLLPTEDAHNYLERLPKLQKNEG